MVCASVAASCQETFQMSVVMRTHTRHYECLYNEKKGQETEENRTKRRREKGRRGGKERQREGETERAGGRKRQRESRRDERK